MGTSNQLLEFYSNIQREITFNAPKERKSNLLRKQTVWFMTMLSLVAVLSVYYLTTPKEDMSSSIFGNNVSKTSEKTKTEDSNIADPVFAQLKLQLNDSRSKMREELQTVVASTNISEEERVKANEQMKELTKLSSTESLLETLIIASGYDDALVRIADNNIRVTVKAKKNSPQAANEIIRMVTKEVGKSEPVSVEFQTAKK
ncbi:MAG: SpoIIIAH-like family protein [Bacillales bacterium]|jgi:stage III sporulation protein AH|nr:SpoIIIAH-like family protein [Bacillales bacterium]